MKYTGRTGEYIEINQLPEHSHLLEQNFIPGELALIWFQKDNNKIKVDNIDYTFQKNDIVFLTEFHKVELTNPSNAKFIKWNKEFYCILNHDSEVGCKGILFYGSPNLPFISIDKEKLETLKSVWQMLEQEFKSSEMLKDEMLQMMLKRILILCTRIYKSQKDLDKLKNLNIDIIREYNFLVEQHFRDKHTVSEYAAMLNKSPKTLSNSFNKLGNSSPLQMIKDRKMLEARRLLAYTDKTVSEIGYEIGFKDVQSFSRFFKKEEGLSPVDYRN